MKTKITLLAISALATLSFTFVSVHSKKEDKIKSVVIERVSNEPVGGFISEDKL